MAAFFSNTVTGAGAQGCEFTLPEEGAYVVHASSTDSTGRQVHSFLPMGWTPREWAVASPYSGRGNALASFLDRQSFFEGDTTTASFYNPYSGAVLLAVSGTSHQSIALPRRGVSTVQVKLDEEVRFSPLPLLFFSFSL